MYMIEYAFTDGIGGSCRNSEGGSDSTASRSINMASTEQMAIEMFVIDHFADHDWLDRIARITATEVKTWAQRCPVARR